MRGHACAAGRDGYGAGVCDVDGMGATLQEHCSAELGLWVRVLCDVGRMRPTYESVVLLNPVSGCVCCAMWMGWEQPELGLWVRVRCEWDATRPTLRERCPAEPGLWVCAMRMVASLRERCSAKTGTRVNMRYGWDRGSPARTLFLRDRVAGSEGASTGGNRCRNSRNAPAVLWFCGG